MDSSLCVGPFPVLVYSALTRAWRTEFFEQILDASHMIPLLRHLPGGYTLLLMQ